MDGASGIRAPRTLGIPVRVPSNTLQLKLRVDVPLSPPSSEFDSWMRLVISSGPAQRMGGQSLFTHVHRLSKRG